MKDFEKGQVVFWLCRDYVMRPTKYLIVSKLYKSNRWRVLYADKKDTWDKEWEESRLRDDADLFANYDDAYEEGLKIFKAKLSNNR